MELGCELPVSEKGHHALTEEAVERLDAAARRAGRVGEHDVEGMCGKPSKKPVEAVLCTCEAHGHLQA